MTIKNPWYTMDVETNQCGFDIRINDCPVGRHHYKATTFNRPINEWIINGNNVITIDLFGLEAGAAVSPDATIGVKLLLRDELDDQFQTIASMEFSGVTLESDGDESPLLASPESSGFVLEQVSHAPLRLRRDVNLEVPFGPWAWQTSKKIDVSLETLAELKTEMQKLHQRLASEDYEGLASVSQERIKEQSAAYYMTDQERTSGMKEALMELMNTPDHNLEPLYDGQLRINGWADKRLVSIADIYDQSVIRTSDSEDMFLGVANFIFRQAADGTWIVCR